jgi:tRNA dimethylallyltransferase
MSPAPPVVAVVGPTAAGKSALALRLAEHLDGEIVNADALQVYRGLDVGTAKPTAGERARVPHHLVDVREPTERFSAGEFARLARAVIEDVHGRGKAALVVGGSGFYLQALFEGLSPLPRPQPEIRAELKRRAAAEGPEALHDELAEVDPETAARLPRGDTQRIVRALEVAVASGRPLSAWIADNPAPSRPLSALHVGLTLPRAILYDRISVRVDRMLERGWLEEVRGLLAMGIPPEAPAFQAIGYRQMVRCIRGELPLDEAIDETVRATRRFAKRQMTWFRKESQVNWFDPRSLAEDMSDILRLLEESG